MPTCAVCQERDHKYKCPTCRILYCSVACYKKHRETPCAPPPASPLPAKAPASLWDTEFGDDEGFELVSVLHGHGGDVKAVCFDACSRLRDDDLLASCSYDDSIKLWGDDGDDWSCRATLTGSGLRGNQIFNPTSM